MSQSFFFPSSFFSPFLWGGTSRIQFFEPWLFTVSPEIECFPDIKATKPCVDLPLNLLLWLALYHGHNNGMYSRAVPLDSTKGLHLRGVVQQFRKHRKQSIFPSCFFLEGGDLKDHGTVGKRHRKTEGKRKRRERGQREIKWQRERKIEGERERGDSKVLPFFPKITRKKQLKSAESSYPIWHQSCRSVDGHLWDDRSNVWFLLNTLPPLDPVLHLDRWALR